MPHTLESLREKDETMLAAADEEEKLEVRLCFCSLEWAMLLLGGW